MALFGRKKKPSVRLNDIVVEPTEAPRPDSASTPWSQLRPSLKRLDAYAFTEAGPYLVSRPVGPFLTEALAFDAPDTMRVLTTTMPEVQQAPLEDYFVTARHNMSAVQLTGKSISVDQQPASAYLVDGPAGYATSWAFRPDRLTQMVAAIGGVGELVVIPCDRDTLYVCTTRDLAVVEQTLDTAWQATVANLYERPISPAAYLMDAGGLVPWQSPVQGPVEIKQRRALAHLSYTSYRAQHEWLAADDDAQLRLLAQPAHGSVVLTGRPMFATKPAPDPGYMVMSSLVQPGPHDHVLICPMEYVLLAGDDGRQVTVPYAAFVEVCANLISPETAVPLPLTRVHGWPTDQQWAQLQRYEI